jgi:hypothetical protein
MIEIKGHPKFLLSRTNWKIVLYLFVITFYLVLMGSWSSQTNIYGNDYLGFWSLGKIANEKGYSAIYDLPTLQAFQIKEMSRLTGKMIDPANEAAMPAPIFSIFVIPFQLFSLISLDKSYWIWILLNLVVLIGYLIFFLRNINREAKASENIQYYLFLALCSFPVLSNIANGQVEVFLLICIGEFLRNAIKQKRLLSGIWLGGLLLKPQILILIIPIMLLMRWWKPLLGFSMTSAVIFTVSFCLSGFSGIIGMGKLWTGYAGGIATNSPEAMLNWRMIALRINETFSTTIGWWIAGIGMLFTLTGLIVLLRRRPVYGSPYWVLVILGVFSATLALTWHAHYHMSLALMPLVLFASMHHQIPDKLTFWWVMLTPLAWIVSSLLGLLVGPSMGNLQGAVIALTGFAMNLVLFFTVVRVATRKEEISYA